MKKPPAIIYSPDYKADFGPHVFPTSKYGLIRDRLAESGLLARVDLLEPDPATADDLALVHLPDYVRDFMNYEYTEAMITSELPMSKEIRDFFLLATGGSILAAGEALARGAAVNVNGGFHHAFPDHAEGFCYLNDPSIALRRMKSKGLITRAAVIDCDLHQGNGTAVIFARDPDVFTFSIHQENLYPLKVRSDLDIGLADRVGDDEYLAKLEPAVAEVIERANPQLVCFVAGADPFERDQLGSLRLTKSGLAHRDDIVLAACQAKGIPVFIVLAGGYAPNVEDVVDIHVGTIRTMLEVWQ